MHESGAMMAAKQARYDGFADWYEQFNSPFAAVNNAAVAGLLGAGEGPCLDVGCGTGLYFDAIRSTGREPLGVDFSADQVRLARSRGRCAQGDAAALPFADGAFAAVLLAWVSTDVDDFAAVAREAARVLRPGGAMVFYGAHPCFIGPHVEYREDGGRIIHPVYRQADWHAEQPWWHGEHNLRNRVGMRHVPLAQFLQAFLGAGLAIERIVEPDLEHPVPFTLALRLVRGA